MAEPTHPELHGLLDAAEKSVLLSAQLTNDQAGAFFQQYPLDAIQRVMTAHLPTEQQLDVVLSALDKCLATPLGDQLLPGALPYLGQALHSPAPAWRRFAVRQAGALAQAPGQLQQQQQFEALSLLIKGLQDADTGVAQAASKALQAAAASDQHLAAALLSGNSPTSITSNTTPSSSPVVQQVGELLQGSDATLRGRLLELVMPLAAQQLQQGSLPTTGSLQQLLAELDTPGDTLAAAAAMVQLQELATAASGPAALLLHQLLLPRLLPLAAQADTASAALNLAAQLVAAGAQALLESPSVGGVTNGVTNGVANGGVHSSAPWANLRGAEPHPLLQQLAALLQEGSNEEQLLALDAAGYLASTPGGAQLMAVSTPPQPASVAAQQLSATSLLVLVLQQALGRTTRGPEQRIAALQAAATWCGIEHAQQQQLQPVAAMLSQTAEEALQGGVWGVVGEGAGGAGGGLTPGEVWAWLVEQPFVELRLAAYRFLAGVLMRSWAAAEATHSPTLLARLTGSSSESGQSACEWRYTALLALSRVLLAPDGSAAAPQWADVAEAVAGAVRAGPYGVGANGRSAAAAAPQSMAV